MPHRRSPCGGRIRGLWRSIRLRLARADAVFVYHPDYAVDFPESMYDRRRPERILAFLSDTGLVSRRDVFVPRPVSMRKLLRVHDAAYLDSLQATQALLPVVGFPVDDAFLERYLNAHRLATGGTVLATDLAWSRRGVAVNLGGGFHHAESARGQGFCVFNDVAVAIRNWRRHGGKGSVLVVDLDLHDGDGTREVFRDDPDVFTLSIHNRDLGSALAIASMSVALGEAVGDRVYLDAVRERVGEVVREVRPALAFYLAGCDPAEDDRLGNWRITADGMLARDRFVFDALRAGADPIPTVVTLAGGYGSGAWRYSARALSSYLNRGVALEPPRTESLTLERFRARFRRIRPHELSAEPPSDDPWSLTPEDLAPGLGGGARRRFLGFYTRHGLEVALARYGVHDRLRERGLRKIALDLDLDPVAGDTARLFSGDWPDSPLMELRARRDSGRIPGHEILSVEWLLLQDPSAEFGESRPRLPGQKHPGLGMLKEVFALLVLMCERLGLDGLVIVAGHYHLVALSDDALRFLDPADRVRFRAMREALAGIPVAEASSVVDRGDLIDADRGEPVAWTPIAMVLPVSERLRSWIDAREAAAGDVLADGHAPRYRVRPAATRAAPVA